MTLEPTSTGEALLLIGHGSRDEEGIVEYNGFADKLAERLCLPVYPCFLEFADPPIVAGIRACVEAGAQQITALPLFLGPAGHQKNDVPAIINWAKSEWPQVQFKYGAPLGAQPQIILVLAQRAAEAIATSTRDIAPADTALLLVGRGSRDPDSNSEVYKIARLLWEGRAYGWVETAFYSLTPPNISVGIERCVRLGAKRVVVMPYLLFTGAICLRTGEQARTAQIRYPQVEILVAEHLSLHPEVIEAAVYRYEEVVAGTATMTCDLCKYRHRLAGFEDEYGLPQTSDHHHGLRGVGHNHDHEHHHHHPHENG
ncbi:MAG: sirohydrochlorin chelatase [Anaerolineae bacterium]